MMQLKNSSTPSRTSTLMGAAGIAHAEIGLILLANLANRALVFLMLMMVKDTKTARSA
jgi:hypothetical protein